MCKHPPSLFCAAAGCPMVFCFDANCLIVFIFMACYYSTRYLPGNTVRAGDIIVYTDWGYYFITQRRIREIRPPDPVKVRERTLEKGHRVYEERTDNGFFYKNFWHTQ